MGIQNPQFFNKTVLDVTIVLSNQILLNQPINLVQGNDVNQIMDIQSDDINLIERTANGDIAGALLPALMHGSIFYTANSPVINQLAQLVQNYYLIGLEPSTVTISSKSGGWSYTLDNVFLKKPFAGYKLGKVIEVTVFDFDCTPPEGFSVSNMINMSGGLVNQI